MNSLFLDLAISTILSTIKSSFKNENSKAQLKRALLKVRNQINLLYAGDADFETL